MCPAADLGHAKLAGLPPSLGTGPVSPWGYHGGHLSWWLQQELVLVLDFRLLVKDCRSWPGEEVRCQFLS